MAYRSPLISVENTSSVVSQVELDAFIKAIKHQVEYHFRPRWNATAHFIQHDPTTASIPGAWVLAITDNSDVAGALGYHDLTSEGRPILKCFAGDDKKYGYEWTVTASHEVLEALGDPDCDLMVQIGPQEFTAYEACDAVEADELGYEVSGVLMSDFQTWDWFWQGSPGPWDFREHCTEPLQLLPGGYMAIWEPDTGWTQEFAGKGETRSPVPYRNEVQSERFRRRKEKWSNVSNR